LLGLFEQVATRNCHTDGPAAIEKADAEFILQLLDLATQRRLCDMQLVGRAPEAALSSDRREISQMTKFHGRSSHFMMLFEYQY
jgi:hypothetical protein